MFLITSGAYVSQDLVSEIGQLPPAFLPVGNQRLFIYQLEQLAQVSSDIYLSIPEGYLLERHDLTLLEQYGVSILPVPEGLTLGESVLYCWNSTGKRYDNLQILHGDTLIRGMDFSLLDSVSIAQNQGYYHRATVSRGNLVNGAIEDAWAGDDEWILSGYFSFNQPQKFIQGIVKNSGDFIAGLKYYSHMCPLKGIERCEWFDFGHINTFFRSRTLITTQREFNEMSITPRVVEKASKKRLKMQAEANWFKTLPEELRIFTPHLVSDRTEDELATYSLEYLYLLPLNDMFVYGRLPGSVWHQIFQACQEVSVAFKGHQPLKAIAPEQLDSLYLPKTLTRLEDFAAQRDFDLNKTLTFNGAALPSLLDIAHETAQLIERAVPGDVGVAHGDFCFSNILYDSRVQAIKLIDPRGLDNEGNLTIYGDRRYDIAKLYHSVIGLYDLIIAQRFELESRPEAGEFYLNFPDAERLLEIQETFRKNFFHQQPKTEKQILAITIHLFLSMLPLHSDRPIGQMAMIANALRLYRMLIESGNVRFEEAA
ncbi:hypothetical protein [Endozoicomonas sp. ALB032]|uniref:hypothetical protein n=1 Tax=Endozoicomonas sp. ALB032 TaxID=3403082 RepID=UPI003BB771B2